MYNLTDMAICSGRFPTDSEGNPFDSAFGLFLFSVGPDGLEELQTQKPANPWRKLLSTNKVLGLKGGGGLKRNGNGNAVQIDQRIMEMLELLHGSREKLGYVSAAERESVVQQCVLAHAAAARNPGGPGVKRRTFKRTTKTCREVKRFDVVTRDGEVRAATVGSDSSSFSSSPSPSPSPSPSTHPTPPPSLSPSTLRQGVHQDNWRIWRTPTRKINYV